MQETAVEYIKWCLKMRGLRISAKSISVVVITGIIALQVLVLVYFYSLRSGQPITKFLTKKEKSYQARKDGSSSLEELFPLAVVPPTRTRPLATHEKLVVIKSPLGYDKLHTPGGLLAAGSRLADRPLYDQSMLRTLKINLTIFDQIQGNAECSTLPAHSMDQAIYCLPEVMKPPIQVTGQARCLVENTVSIRDKRTCICKEGWFGSQCNIPLAVEKSDYPYEYGVKIMSKPRRIIYAFPFSYEFEMLEARLAEVGEIVDTFLVVESNYTASGVAKERLLWNRLQTGYLKEYHAKIVYVFLNYFPVEGFRDGWVVDELIRNYISAKGLPRLHNVREDDIFLLTDADELPQKEVLFFLKYHYGYPEPVAFYFRHSTFRFDWVAGEGHSRVFGAVTIGMLRFVFTGHAYFVRRATSEMNTHKSLVDDFKFHHGGRIHAWSAGAKTLPVGWHCSWCLSVDRIRAKLIAAHVSDVPRWGNFPEKRNVDYISKLVERGLWFDDKTSLLKGNRSHPMLAPKFILDHHQKYRYILE